MMDIDRLHQKKKNQPKGKGKSQPRPGPSARPPAPKPFMGRSNVPIGGGLHDRRTVPRGVCFRCLKPGHFAANCSESINNISPEHINALVSFAVDSYEIPIGPEEDEETQEDPYYEEDNDEEDEYHQINQVSDNLIDFNEPDDVEEVSTSTDPF